MSTYEFHCKHCGHVFDKDMSIAEHEKHKRVKCPKCQSTRGEQVPTAFQTVTSKKA